MNKITKAVAAIVLAGTMCAGAGVISACSITEVEGKSAYEIAVDNGFKGTEQEWLDSLKVSTTVESSSVSYSINDKGEKVATFTFKMSDGTTQIKTEILPVSVVNVELNYLSQYTLWTKAEITDKNYNLAGINWKITYDNGYIEYLPVTKEHVIDVMTEQDYDISHGWSSSYCEDAYKVSVVFNKVWAQAQTFGVYAVDNLETFNAANETQTSISQASYICRKGEAFGLNNLYVENRYEGVEVVMNYGEGQTGSDYIYDVTRYEAVTADMLDKAIDTSTVGTKTFEVTVGEGASALKEPVILAVYDKSVSNVQSASVRVEPINLVQGDTEKTIATEAAKLVGQPMEVYFYEYDNGELNRIVKITKDMIDYSDVNQEVAGTYVLNVNYGGYAAKVAVVVSPDMETATLEHTLNGSGLTGLALMGMPEIDEIKLYSNGFAELSASGMELTEYIGYFGYTLENDILTLTYNGEKFVLFNVDTENNAFSAYDFSELTATAEYTVNLGANGIVKTYANGFATLDMADTLYVNGYKVEGTTLSFTALDEVVVFEIGADNKLELIQKM